MLNATKAATMITLFSCMGQGENHYTAVSIDTTLKLLDKFHGIHVKRRWIFCCLKDLLKAGLITRKTRHRQDENGLISQLSSMLAFTIKGMRYLSAKRVTGAWKLLKAMLKFVSGQDQRWPKKKDIQEGSYWPEGTDERERLKGLLGIVGRGI